MKTLIKLANSCNKNFHGIYGNILFDGNAARSTDCETHAVVESGQWNFDRATVVSAVQIKSAMALSKKPVWKGDTLNGVKLVNVADANDWIALPDVSKAHRIDAANLASALQQVLPAVAIDDIRYYINGVCVDFGTRAIVGCDGYRLHMVSNAFTSDAEGQAIVPRSAFKPVGVGNVIHLDFTKTHYRLGYCGGYLVGALICGKFPDYGRVTPAQGSRPHITQFNDAQTASVKTIAAVCKANKVKFPTLAISPDGSIASCNISVPCFDGFKLNAKTYESGEPKQQEIYRVNSNYLYDAMLCAGHGTIASSDSSDSILIQNGDFTAVVMPCRV